MRVIGSARIETPAEAGYRFVTGDSYSAVFEDVTTGRLEIFARRSPEDGPAAGWNLEHEGAFYEFASVLLISITSPRVTVRRGDH